MLFYNIYIQNVCETHNFPVWNDSFHDSIMHWCMVHPSMDGVMVWWWLIMMHPSCIWCVSYTLNEWVMHPSCTRWVDVGGPTTNLMHWCIITHTLYVIGSHHQHDVIMMDDTHPNTHHVYHIFSVTHYIWWCTIIILVIYSNIFVIAALYLCNWVCRTHTSNVWYHHIIMCHTHIHMWLWMLQHNICDIECVAHT